MNLSEQVGVLEQQFEAFKQAYKEDLETELSEGNMYLQDLTSFESSTDVKNQFYPLMLKLADRRGHDISLGSVFPLRKLVLQELRTYSLGDEVNGKVESVFRELSNRRGYACESIGYLHDERRVIKELGEGVLPRDPIPF